MEVPRSPSSDAAIALHVSGPMARPGLARRLAGVLTPVAVAFLVLMGGGTAVYYATFRLLDLVIAWFVLLAWGAVMVLRPEWRPQSLLAPGLLVVLVTFLISSLVSSSPRIGLEYTAYSGVLIALYLLLVSLLRDPFIRPRLLSAIPMLCLVIALAYIVIVGVDWIHWWSAIGGLAVPPLRPRIEGLTYANPSTVMAMGVLLLASSGAILGRTGRPAIALSAVALLTVVMAFLTGSRGGLIGLAAGLGALLLMVLIIEGAGALRRALLNRNLRRSILLAAVPVLAVGALMAPSILGRLTGSGGDLRVSFALASLRGFAESPLTGSGPGMWAIHRVAHTVHPERDRYIPHAHNLFFQTLSEFGVLGVAAGIVIGTLVVLLVWRALREADPHRRRWAYASVFAIGYLIGHQQVDLFANVPAVLFAGALPLAVLDATRPARAETEPRASQSGRILTGAVVAGLLLSAPWLARIELEAATYERAVGMANAGDWEGALPLFRSVAAAEPDLAVYQLALGLAEARDGDLPQAETAFAAAARLDDFPAAWLNLAAVQLEQGKTQEATASLERAFRLGRQHPAIAVGIADVHLRLGNVAAASEAFVEAVARSPTLASDPAWRRNPALVPLRETVIDRAIALAHPALAWQVAIEAGRSGDAQERVDRLPGHDRLLARMVLEAVTDPGAGSASLWWQHVEARLADVGTVDTAAWVATLLGDESRVERYRRVAETISTFAPRTGRMARMIPGSEPDGLLAHESMVFHGLYAYRRPLSHDHLVPGLTHLAWR